MTQESREKRRKQNEMARVFSNILRNFSKYDFDESLRDKIEDDLKNHSMYEYGTISYADLAEFLFQVGGCIFFVKNDETEK